MLYLHDTVPIALDIKRRCQPFEQLQTLPLDNPGENIDRVTILCDKPFHGAREGADIDSLLVTRILQSAIGT